MKIGITGHTQGFGYSLATVFNSKGYTVSGFSRSNGYDISVYNNRTAIIESIENSDVFINNAYHQTGQLELLTKVLKCWEGTEKIVVNVSSIIVYKNSSYFKGEMAKYRESKIKLNNIIDQYKGSVKILNIIPGLMNTNFNIIPINFDRSNSIETNSLAELVYSIVNNHNNFVIKEIIVDNNGTFNSKSKK